jgi:hypothetical protein
VAWISWLAMSSTLLEGGINAGDLRALLVFATAVYRLLGSRHRAAAIQRRHGEAQVGFGRHLGAFEIVLLNLRGSCERWWWFAC